MLSRPFGVVAIVLGAIGLASAPAPAQFSADPGVNTVVSDPAGEQTLPRIASTSTGGYWVTWFSNENSNYNLRAQRFTGAGVPVFAAPGLLISDKAQNSALFGYDMLVDDQDHLVVVLSDERVGPVLNIVAYRIAPDGQFRWGAMGIQLSSNTFFEPDPRVVQAGPDAYVFVWPSSDTLVMQTLNRLGQKQLGATAVTIATGSPGIHAMVATPNGNVIVGYQRRIAFPGPARFLDAQKFTPAAQALWNGGSPVVVSDAAQLGVAARPQIASDEVGGVVFAWSDDRVANASNVFVQHLDTNGVAQFIDDGLAVSSLANRQRFEPAMSYDAENDLINVAWDERDSAQADRGLYAQAIDVGTGALTFGPNGIELIPLSGDALSDIRAQQLTGSVFYACQQDQGGFTSDRTLAFRIGPDAMNRFPSVPLALSTNPARAFRCDTALATSGLIGVVWQDTRTDTGGVYLQTVNPSGALGPAPCPSDWNGDGFVNDTDFFDWVNDFFNATGPQGQSDFNADGFENNQDWFDFINAFFNPFPGCNTAGL